MLTATEKSFFRELVKKSIRDNLIGGKAQFNFQTCEIGFNNLLDKEKVVFLGYLEKYFCDKQYKELGNKTLIDFLLNDYRPKKSFNPFSGNFGKLLRTNLLNLVNSSFNFRVSIQKEKNVKLANIDLNNKYLTFIASLCNFYSEENIYN